MNPPEATEKTTTSTIRMNLLSVSRATSDYFAILTASFETVH